jgi:hypothetical protein
MEGRLGIDWMTDEVVQSQGAALGIKATVIGGEARAPSDVQAGGSRQ